MANRHFLIKGIPTNTDEFTLTLFLENLIHSDEVEVTNLRFNQARNLAIADCDQDIDVVDLCRRAKLKAFMSQYLEIENIPESDKIVVKGLHTGETLDSIVLKYEKLFGDVDEDLSELRTGVAVIKFLDPKDALKATSNSHTLSNQQERAELWTPLFNFPDDQDEKHVSKPVHHVAPIRARRCDQDDCNPANKGITFASVQSNSDEDQSCKHEIRNKGLDDEQDPEDFQNYGAESYDIRRSTSPESNDLRKSTSQDSLDSRNSDRSEGSDHTRQHRKGSRDFVSHHQRGRGNNRRNYHRDGYNSRRGLYRGGARRGDANRGIRPRGDWQGSPASAGGYSRGGYGQFHQAFHHNANRGNMRMPPPLLDSDPFANRGSGMNSGENTFYHRPGRGRTSARLHRENREFRHDTSHIRGSYDPELGPGDSRATCPPRDFPHAEFYHGDSSQKVSYDVSPKADERFKSPQAFAENQTGRENKPAHTPGLKMVISAGRNKVALLSHVDRHVSQLFPESPNDYYFDQGKIHVRNNDLKLKFFEKMANIDDHNLNEKIIPAKMLPFVSRHLDEVLKMFSEQSCACIVLKKDNEITMIGMTEKDLESAEKILYQYLGTIHCQDVNTNKSAHVVKTKDWTDGLKSLKEVVDISSKDGIVSIVGKTDDVKTASVCLETLLKENDLQEITHAASRGQWMLLRDHSSGQKEFKALYTKKISKIEFDRKGDEHFIKVSATASNLDLVNSVIDETLKRVKTNEMKITKPGFQESDIRGNSIVHALTKQHQCIVDVISTTDTQIVQYPKAAITKSSTDFSTPLEEAVGGADAGSRIRGKPSSRPHVKHCDIRYVDVDVIVCTVADKAQSLNKGGALANAFLEICGAQLDREYSKLCDGQIKAGRKPYVYPNELGFLKCTLLCFIGLKPWRVGNPRQLSAVQNVISDCLDIVKLYGLESIAFPAIGCGGFKFPPGDVAAAFVEATSRWLQRNENYPIKVTVAAIDENVYRTFKSVAMGNPVPSSTANKEHIHGYTKVGFSHAQQTITRYSLMVRFSAWTPSAISGMKKDFNQWLDSQVFEDMIHSHVLANLSRSDKSALLKLNGPKVKVNLDEKCGRISIEGEKKAVVETKSRADSIIRQAEIDQSKRKDDPVHVKKLHGTTAYLKSLAEEDTKLPPNWKYYRGKVTDILSKIKGKKFSPASDDLKAAIEAIMKKSWISALVGHGRDARYQTKSNIKIIEIRQIENPDLYMDYAARKKKFCLRAVNKKFPRLSDVNSEKDILTRSLKIPVLDNLVVPEINEVFLFHGTSSQNKEGIAEQGLDFRIASSSGMFGQGIYFAESSTKADQYSSNNGGMKGMVMAATGFGQPTSSPRIMFLSRVLVGNPYVCQRPQPSKRPPCTSICHGACTHQEFFDTVVGISNGSGTRLNFREFIVYDKSQCYPEFVIEYTTV